VRLRPHVPDQPVRQPPLLQALSFRCVQSTSSGSVKRPRCHLATWFKTSSAACSRHLQHLELSLAVTLLACMQLIQGSNPASCKSQTFLITFCFLLASPRQRPLVLAPSSQTRGETLLLTASRLQSIFSETLLLTASRLQSIFSFVRLNRHHF
jgi:hypothetical protein